MTIPRLEDLDDLSGAKVLLRLDLNVPVEGGVVSDETRVAAAVPTLRWLLERVAVIAACSHLGKPKGKPVPELSLRPVAPVLERQLGVDVVFVPDCTGAKVAEAVARATSGTLLLLENLRFHGGETSNDPGFTAALCEPFTHYVNDAFGTAHRAHASVAGAPARFAAGHRCAGRLMEMEVDALLCLMNRSERPFMAVVGGAKVSTKTAPLEALLESVQTLALGGGLANTFFLAQGHPMGQSLVEVGMVDAARAVMERAAERGVELLLPEDLVVTDSLSSATRVEIVPPEAVPASAVVADIGPATRETYRQALSTARSAFWNGPMGVFEREPFAAGTMDLARALAASAAFTVVGGGESVMAVHRAGVGDAVSHVSTGGGASLTLIAGGEMPAIAALEG